MEMWAEFREWITLHPTVVGWLVAASIIMFVGSLLAVPMIVVRIPEDYFTHATRPRPKWMPKIAILRLTVLALKNIAGAMLVLSGLAMLLLPGQGILTMLAGMMLLDFPGKYRLEKWLVTRGPTWRTINWLRCHTGHNPLVAIHHNIRG